MSAPLQFDSKFISYILKRINYYAIYSRFERFNPLKTRKTLSSKTFPAPNLAVPNSRFSISDIFDVWNKISFKCLYMYLYILPLLAQTFQLHIHTSQTPSRFSIRSCICPSLLYYILNIEWSINLFSFRINPT